MTDGVTLLRQGLASIRTRLVVSVLVVLLLGVGGTALVSRQVLMASIDERIHDQLVQEVEELRVLARTGFDPTTGEAFGADVSRLLTVFLERTVPADGEVMVTYLDGEPFQRTVQRVPYRIDTDPALTDRWGATAETLQGVVDTPAGPLHHLAVPVQSTDDRHAVFVVAQFRDVVATEVARTVQVTAWVGLASLVAAGVLAVGLARRILEPLGRMTQAAEEISESDLSRRLDVDGHDELARLAATFNAMLGRLETAFGQQRQFVDDAGHELRTPITVIRGHLELLDHGDHEDREATVALVLDELDRMHRIVEDLLVLATADQPDFVVPAILDMDELTTSTLQKATSMSPDHSWELDEVAVGMIEADRHRLTQALMQLAANAARHAAPGTTIGVGSALGTWEVRLWVRDRGPGIDPADHDRIFERFARASSGPRRGEGAGLGLAIVRAIAEAHGGSVEVDSALGEGATFTLRLPRVGPVDPVSSWDDTQDLADETQPLPVREHT